MCGDTAISKLYVTEVMFWNDGRMLIEGSDLFKGEKDTDYRLRIEAIDGQIFGQPSCEASGTNNGLDCRNNEVGSVVVIDFNYLAYGEGFIIAITHTGRVELRGSIRGAQLQHQGDASGCLAGFLLMLPMVIIFLYWLLYDRPIPKGWEWQTVAALWGPIVLAFFVMAWNPIPKEFRKFIKGRRIEQA